MIESRNCTLFCLYSWIDQLLYSVELCPSKRDELQSCTQRHGWLSHAKALDSARLHLIISLFSCSGEERNKGQSPGKELPSSYSQLWHVDSPRQSPFTLQTEFPFLLNWAQSIYPLLVFCADGLESIWNPSKLKWLSVYNHIIKREMKLNLHLHHPVIVWLVPVSSLKKTTLLTKQGLKDDSIKGLIYDLHPWDDLAWNPAHLIHITCAQLLSSVEGT